MHLLRKRCCRTAEVTDLLARHQNADHDPVNAKFNRAVCLAESTIDVSVIELSRFLSLRIVLRYMALRAIEPTAALSSNVSVQASTQTRRTSHESGSPGPPPSRGCRMRREKRDGVS